MKFIFVSILFSLVLTSCGGGGGGSDSPNRGSTTSVEDEYGAKTNSTLTVDNFVTALNRVDHTDSFVREYDTLRNDGNKWFVIFDDFRNEFKAVSLQYVRSIVYYDYYFKDTATAEEFRSIEEGHIIDGYDRGDPVFADYEEVEWNPNTERFVGFNSGFEYEDESETRDVNLMEADQENLKMFKRASNISAHFQLSLKTSFSLLSLSQKFQGMRKNDQGHFTEEDQNAVLKDVEHLTGVTLEDFIAAAKDPVGKEDLIDTVARNLGTTSANLENRLLPELIGN